MKNKMLSFLRSALLTALLTACCTTLLAAGVRITVDYNRLPLKQALEDLRSKSGYDFLFNSQLIDPRLAVTVKKTDAELTAVLDAMFEGTNIGYTIDERQVVLFPREAQPQQPSAPPVAVATAPETGPQPVAPAAGQPQEARMSAGTIAVRGLVTDDNGAPLAGATVLQKYPASTRGTVAGTDGRFELSGVPSDGILAVSYLGFKTADVPVRGRASHTIALEPNVERLQDVVVTGYQTLSRERAAGSFTVLSNDLLASKVQPDLLSRIEGMAAGYTAYNGDIRIRGTATLFGGQAAPLYVVDGVPLEGGEDYLKTINPAEVQNITILKDATASSIYGARSTNGVIVITTRTGQANKTVVEYDGTFVVAPNRDERSYLKLMNSAELVDWQQEMFNTFHETYSNLNTRYYLNPVSKALYDNEAGTLGDAQLKKTLDAYRSRNNYDQLVDNFLRSATFSQYHNLSVRGGTDRYRYAVSANYNRDALLQKGQDRDRIGYNVKGQYNFYRWLSADLTLLGSYASSDNDNGFNAVDYLTGGRASYYTLFDESGAPQNWYMEKSQSEMDRLAALGLQDESYYPMQELGRANSKTRDWYNNINLGLKFKVAEGLSAELRFQTELGNGYEADLLRKDSYTVRTTVNNATRMENGKAVNYIPTGGKLNEERSDWSSYILRAQVNYDRTFNDRHAVTALAGAERRSWRTASTQIEKWGYDEYSLVNKYIDEISLARGLTGTEAIGGAYTYQAINQPQMEIVNRFVAFYANGSYRYNDRYGLTASVRIDQTNLFGTDPKFQYRPFWSLGANWIATNEEFMQEIDWLDFLNVRATYGVNGNIPKFGGPYMIISGYSINAWTNESSSRIENRPNKGLHWERTNQFNAGVDFRILGNRLGGTVEVYNKNTIDLMGDISVDPTSGTDKTTRNYGGMFNRGVELTLDGDIVRGKKFNWTAMGTFSYNQNRITRLENAQTSVESYVSNPNTREGQPMGTLYSFRWKGLNSLGSPVVYMNNGKSVQSMSALTVGDLINSGTSIPPFAASLVNNLSYNRFELSLQIIYYGGHVMRDAMAPFISRPEAYNYTGLNAATNMNRNIANYWKIPEDSNDPSKSPAVNRNATADQIMLWYGADKHILRADYIKLRDVTLSYTLPEKWLRKAFVSNVTLRAQVQNLCTIGFNGEGLNPEAWEGTVISEDGGAYRTPRPPVIYNFGVNVRF